jgi:Family of unknown function (DUF6159)
MRRIRQGFDLLQQSWNVLKADPEMILVAVAGLVVSVGVFVLFFIFGIAPDGDPSSFGDILAWIPIVFVGAVVGNFVAAAMVGAACIRMGGGDPTIADAVRIAWRNMPKILGWSVFVTTVGVILRLVSERIPFGGRLVAILGGVAFHLASILVVPVLLFEDKGVVDSFKRSAELFKEKWGESATGVGGVGLATLVMFIPIVVVGALLLPLSPLAGAIVLVLGGLLLVGLSTSLNGIFTAALYRYATSGEAPPGFSRDALEGSFPESKTKKRFSGFLKRA